MLLSRSSTKLSTVNVSTSAAPRGRRARPRRLRRSCDDDPAMELPGSQFPLPRRGFREQYPPTDDREPGRGSIAVGKAGTRALPLDLAAALVRGALDDPVPLVEHPLDPGHGILRVPGDLGRELDRRLLRAGRGRDAVDQVHPQRLVGTDVARGQQQVLGGREAAEGDEPRRADWYPELRSGELEPEVAAGHPQVAGHGDLRPAAHHRAVAGGDRGLGRRRSRRRRRRTAACGAPRLVVGELLADVGAGREAEVVVGEITSTRTLSSSRAVARWPSISSSIWVFMALRACSRSRRRRHAGLVDRVARHRVRHQPPAPPPAPRSQSARSGARPRRPGPGSGR